MSETGEQAASETPARRPGVLRETVSLVAGGAGLAGLVVCLVHLGWWLAGFSLSVLALVLGVLGASRRVSEIPEPLQHVIEVRHTDGTD